MDTIFFSYKWLPNSLSTIDFVGEKINLSDYIKGWETIKLNIFKLCVVENF